MINFLFLCGNGDLLGTALPDVAPEAALDIAAPMATSSVGIGDQLLEGVSQMIVGLGVVFAVLILLTLIISAFKLLNKLDKSEQPEAPKAPKAAPAPVKAAAPAAAPAAKGPGAMEEGGIDIEGEIDGDTAAAVLGAVAQECGGNFKVTSIKKSK